MDSKTYYFLIIQVALDILKAKTAGATAEAIGVIQGTEQIIQAALQAHAAESGKTMDEILAGLKPIDPIP